MPEIISSPIGQSLALGGLVVSFPSPADVQTALKAGYHVFETTSAMHRAILAAAAPDEDLRSFIIVTGDPSGTVYTFDGDSLDPIYDPSTVRSEEHTSELQSLMRISYAVFCLTKKNKYNHTQQ